MSAATIVQWLVCTELALAFLLQLAVFRAPDLPDTPATRVSRILMIGALFIGFCYLSYLSSHGVLADKPMTLVLAVMALAQLNSAKSKLFPEHDPAPPESQRGDL